MMEPGISASCEFYENLLRIVVDFEIITNVKTDRL